MRSLPLVEKGERVFCTGQICKVQATDDSKNCSKSKEGNERRRGGGYVVVVMLMLIENGDHQI